MTLTKRSTYLDLLKLLACFLVCVNHAEVFHWYLSLPADGSLLTLGTTTISILSKINVPLYFMVTGAVLLKKEETYSQILRKRVPRFAVVLFLATLLKCLLVEPEQFAPMRLLRTLFSGSICVSYWFLYAYLGMLLILPLLQRIAKVLRTEDILMIIALRIAMNFLLPSGNALLESVFFRPVKVTGYLELPFSTCDILFYPLVGSFLAGIPAEKLTKKTAALCWLVLAAGTGINLAVVHYYGTVAGFSQTHICYSTTSSVIAVFLLVRMAGEKWSPSEKTAGILAKLSGCTLGIYISESFLWDYLSGPFNNILWTLTPVPRLVGNVVWCLMIMTLGTVITFLFRKIPGCRKLL